MPDHEFIRHAKPTHQELNRDILGRFGAPGGGFWLALIILGLLGVAGVIGFIVRLAAGFPNTAAWGYYAATVGYLLSTVMAAPIVIAGLRFTKAVWIHQLSRPAFLFAIPGILFGLMFLALLNTLPPLEGRASLWFHWPISYLRWVDTLAVIFLVILGLALLWNSAKPDWVALRQSPGRHGPFSTFFGRGWVGSLRQWDILQRGGRLLGAYYIFFYAFATMLISIDFDMSLLPGWRSAIYPTYHIITSAQAAVALLLVTSALLRRFGGWGDYLRLDQFWALGKLLLALTLLWFYFFWSGFIVTWYGRTPREQDVLTTTEFGPYFVPFVLTAVFAFAVPFVMLIWNHVRKSLVGPPIAATSVLIGLFFDRIRLYVPAYAAAGQGGPAAGQVLPTRFPDSADLAIMVGALAAVAAVYLLAMRIVPAISLWEVKRAYLLSETRRFLRGSVEVVAKPE